MLKIYCKSAILVSWKRNMKKISVKKQKKQTDHLEVNSNFMVKSILSLVTEANHTKNNLVYHKTTNHLHATNH